MATGDVLVIDVGNTRMKAALFRAGRVLRHATLAHGDLAALHTFLAAERPEGIALGSVAHPNARFLADLQAIAPVVVLQGDTPSPYPSDVREAGTLGVDRLADVVAVAHRYPGRAALVVDLGTCITHDVVAPDGRHLGGAISPGLRMRASAMHAYSARLPLVDPDPSPRWPGRDTTDALAAGIHHGILLEIQGLAERVAHQWPDAAVVLTGGDAPRFGAALKSGIFAVPLLTLEGLHVLYQHHRTLHAAPGSAAPADDGAGTAG